MFEPRPAARRRIRNLTTDAADQFESTLLHHRVYEQVQGQHGKHNDLARLLDLAEGAYQLADDRDHDTDVFGAAETLNDQVEDLVDEQIATACAVIVTEADAWTDAWDEETIAEAQIEAKQWLGDHLTAAERAGVAEEVVAHV